MNCRDFDAIVSGLVRRETPRAMIEEARAHVASCARCAPLLAKQQSLSIGLKALAARPDEDRAAERIESALRAEFRRQHAGAVEPGVYGARATTLSSFPLFWQRRSWVLVPIIITLAVVLIMGRFQQRPRVSSWTQSHPHTEVQPSSPHPAVVAAVSTQHPAIQSAAKQKGSRPRGRVGSRWARARLPDSRDEWTTYFYSLPNSSGLDLDEGWQMVRVDMPVSALATLGVPLVNEGSSNQYVKADVVLAADGTARAIRFVQ